MCQRASMLAILLLKETAVKSALCYKTCSKHLQLHPWAFQSCESLFIQTSNWEKKNTLSFFQLIWKIFGFSKQKNFTDCNQMEKKILLPLVTLLPMQTKILKCVGAEANNKEGQLSTSEKRSVYLKKTQTSSALTLFRIFFQRKCPSNIVRAFN